MHTDLDRAIDNARRTGTSASMLAADLWENDPRWRREFTHATTPNETISFENFKAFIQAEIAATDAT